MGLFNLFKKKNKKDSEILDELLIREHLKDEETEKKAEPVKKAAKEKPVAAAKKEETGKAAPAKKEPARKVTAVKKEAPKAEPVLDEDDGVSDDDESVVIEESAKPARNGKFDIKKSKDGRYYFSLYASNMQAIAFSQLYSSVSGATNGIKSVITHATKAAIEDTTLKKPEPKSFPKWEIYIDKAGEYRFRLYASNGSCICHSHGYASKATCKGGMESIQRFASDSAGIDKAYLTKK